MRADNNGEGGIMSLLALNLRSTVFTDKNKIFLIALGFIGASLFFGDGIITPAISVLSAIEGLSLVTPALDQWLVPIALGILTALFLVQRHGTATMGKFFGPITLLWFVSIGLIGLWSIIQTPYVLMMVNPYWALHFVFDQMGGFCALCAKGFTPRSFFSCNGHYSRASNFFLVSLAFFRASQVLPYSRKRRSPAGISTSPNGFQTGSRAE